MEVDSNKYSYDVQEAEDEYETIPKRPIRNEVQLEIHDTIPVGRKGLFFIIGIQVFIILILIILLGINGVTLSQLNTVDMCDSTGATTGDSTGASTAGVGGDTSTAQILNVTQELLNQRNNDAKVTEALYQVLASNMTQVLQQLMYTQGNSEQLNTHTNILQGLNKNISQVSQQLGSTEAKVDGMRSVVDEHLVHTLNMSDVLNQVKNTTGQSAQRLINIVNTLSNLQDTSTSTAGVVDGILVIAEDLLQLQNVSSLLNSITPVSCKDVKEVLPNSPSGWYHINNQNTYCNMEELCGSGGGWTRLGYLDMTDASQSCPSGFRLYQSGGVRACGRTLTYASCSPIITFPTNGIGYTQICGRVKGYQKGSTDAIYPNSQHNNINSYYLDGVSITRGHPREHIWSFIGGVFSVRSADSNCPCNTNAFQANYVQSFIGNNYYCESGNPNTWWSNSLYPNDPLWDGQNCPSLEAPCCTNPNLPWFFRDFGNATSSEDLELRVCGDEGWNDEDNPVGEYEIYVK